MKVNFIDLKVQYHSCREEIDAAIAGVIEQSAFSGGAFVDEFEKNFRRAHQTRYCVGVNSGTSALHIILLALEIGCGDEVIVPANSFFATAEAVSLTGAIPVFVDCEPDYYNIDPSLVERAITPKTKAVIAVHLYGQPARVKALTQLCRRRGIHLIEDCAQAHLAFYDGTPVGGFGICSAFSFYPSKNLGAFGEAGAVLTNDDTIYERLCFLRNHGSTQKYYHRYVGHNYRMDGIQGAVLNVKLKRLPKWTEMRVANAAVYRSFLKNIKNIVLPEVIEMARHVYHLFVVRAERRDELIEFLLKKGIQTGIHYPVACHLQKAYARYKVSLPVCEAYAAEIVSLPMYPELTRQDIAYVCKAIREFYTGA
jgi:dTDP-4-amino-4,6-dideoxygalactose transaminase